MENKIRRRAKKRILTHFDKSTGKITPYHNLPHLLEANEPLWPLRHVIKKALQGKKVPYESETFKIEQHVF